MDSVEIDRSTNRSAESKAGLNQENFKHFIEVIKDEEMICMRRRITNILSSHQSQLWPHTHTHTHTHTNTHIHTHTHSE